jgi:hypothetical protein
VVETLLQSAISDNCALSMSLVQSSRPIWNTRRRQRSCLKEFSADHFNASCWAWTLPWSIYSPAYQSGVLFAVPFFLYTVNCTGVWQSFPTRTGVGLRILAAVSFSRLGVVSAYGVWLEIFYDQWLSRPGERHASSARSGP